MAMNFRPRRSEAPEINLIPFIDVLLVILIFLMLTTTYSKFTELELTLPTADTTQMRDRPRRSSSPSPPMAATPWTRPRWKTAPWKLLPARWWAPHLRALRASSSSAQMHRHRTSPWSLPWKPRAAQG